MLTTRCSNAVLVALLLCVVTESTMGQGQPTRRAHRAAGDTTPPRPRESHYAQVGNLSMYYELYGHGRPMLLLHGGSETIEESFHNQLAYFSAHRLLIAPEQQGHGHTRDIDAPLDYGVMADNTAQLLQQLGTKDVDILGWSDGGIVGLLLAAKHPELVRRLVVTGASILPVRQAFGADIEAQVTAWKPDSQGIANYARRFVDSVSHYPVFIDKLKDLWLKHPTEAELGPQILARIHAPTLVIDGDRESALLEHTISIYRNLAEAQLLIVPGTGHNTLGTHPEWLNPVILAFLDHRASTH